MHPPSAPGSPSRVSSPGSPLCASVDQLQWVVHDVPSVGPVAIPNLPWWTATRYVMLIEELEFNPELFLFDRIVSVRGGLAALADLNDMTDGNAVALRRNLGVLRNVLMAHLFPNPGRPTAEKRAQLEQMALHVAAMLKRGQSGKDHLLGLLTVPGSASLAMTLAVQERAGGAALFRTLQQLSSAPGLWRKLMTTVGLAPALRWQLPPLVHTPFLPAHLHAVLIEEDESDKALPWQDGFLPEALLIGQTAELSDGLAVEDVALAEQFQQSVDALSGNIKRQAVDIAHEILRKLKLSFHDVPMETLLQHDPARLAEAFVDMEKLIQIYETYLTMASDQQPSLMEDDIIMDANLSIGKLLYQAKHFALQQAVGAKNISGIASLQKDLASFPDSMREPGKDTVNDVLGSVEKALQKVLGVLKTANMEAPGEAERAIGVQKGHELGEADMRLAQIVGMGEEMQRLQAQQAAQRNAMLQANLATQQANQRQQQQRQQPTDRAQQTGQESRRSTTTQQQGRVSRTQANLMRQQRAQRQARLQQRLQQQQQAAHHHEFGQLLGNKDVEHMRGSFNAPTTGDMIQPGSAKDTIRRERERQEKRERKDMRKAEEQKTGMPAAGTVAMESAPAMDTPQTTMPDGTIPPPRPPKRNQKTGR